MLSDLRITGLVIFLIFLSGLNTAYSQLKISGTVKSLETNEPVSGADVTLTPGTKRTSTDNEGRYEFTSLTPGKYIVKVNYVGYEKSTFEVELSADFTANFSLKQGSITTDELIVEINRAKERETPVAFTNIAAKDIKQRIAGQDAPMIIKGVPGMYSYSTDGVGNGEGNMLVRGFSQNYVQVMINGIPTNDPESNAVYWSNWGSVSANAGSFQIQRGAGSSLYGSGSFGGSFNIITENPDLKHFYGLDLTYGSPLNTMYGLTLNSGMINKKYSGYLNVERKIAEGTRKSGRYEGVNYYTSISFYPDKKQSFKLVIHGAPQEHGYSYSNPIAYFKKYGFTANSAPFLPTSIVGQLGVNATTGAANYGLTDGLRELKDNDFVNLSHNFYHKPQTELHYTYDLNKKSQLLATAFWTIGRGGGSSITGAGTVYNLKRGPSMGTGYTIDTITTNLYGSDGYINSLGVADTVYLKTAQQRISYSFHGQYGILTSYTTQLGKQLKITGGAEFRNWTADHPGHFTNLFGKKVSTISYAADTSTTPGVVKIASFTRRVAQGDLDGPGDLGNPFSWNISSSDPNYKTQYRNYQGKTPQITIFAQGNYSYNNFNLMATLQYVWYKYTLTERMPSENAIGKQLTSAQASALGLVDSTSEGAKGDKFYMRGTNGKFYEFTLVNESRSRGFVQPKVGLNFNATKNLNVFGSFAHVERFVDLGVFYNQGRVNPDAQDEKSDQYEFGFGWESDQFKAKVNGYYMLWKNKSAYLQDASQAGQPGYDRNGYKTELVGTSEHKGIELELSSKLDRILPVKGFGLKGSFTFMDNKWKEVLPSVLNDPITGKRRPFNAGALDANGAVDTLYFDELTGKHVASGPQLMFSLGLSFEHKAFFTGIDMNYYAKQYVLDGETYMGINGSYIGTTSAGKDIFQTQYDNQLPARAIFDYYIGYNYSFSKWFKGNVSIQVLNVLDKEYLANADRNGVLPGMKRSFRFNISAGL